MAGETEKLTLNLGPVDLGQIDLLVGEGFYSNRADFLRTAVRNQIAQHAESVKGAVARHGLGLGLHRITRRDLELARAAGTALHVRVLGLATIDDDVPAELARAAIASVGVLGAFRCSDAVREALADRIQ
jgi:Arc/MetJ-type ribon-helix-helix transcriptional regulator